jgi:hypothetical protein
MGKYTIDIIQRFGVAFGQLQQRVTNNLLGFNYSLPENFTEEETVAGSPFFDEVSLHYNDAAGNAKAYTIDLPPMIDLKMTKRINTTSLNEAIVGGKSVGGGEVVESMGNQNWDITFRGLLVDMKDHKRPLDQVQKIVNVVKINDIFGVTCRYFNKVGISQLYIKDISLPPLEGFQDTQPFIIEARSYAPATLQINS